MSSVTHRPGEAGAHTTTPPSRATVRLAVVGDYLAGFPPHAAVDATLAQIADARDYGVRAQWVPTDALAAGPAPLASFDAIWIAPGSPYRSLDGALHAIRHAREHHVPLLGTCGGFQHVIVEFGRNVLGLETATHEEIDPGASCLIVTALSCSPAGQSMPVRLEPTSRPAHWYGATDISERYFCNYGINPAFEDRLHDAGLRIVGRDPANEPRVVDLDGHPFFVGALFVPQPAPAGGGTHPLVSRLLDAAYSSIRG